MYSRIDRARVADGKRKGFLRLLQNSGIWNHHIDDMMEVEGSDDGMSEETVFDVADYLDDAAFEKERCGICMDLIIDRGVLNCCDDWFCFACIDNWATITNLCPLCKKEFHLITCLPVYDTIGNSKVEEESLSRDDDWCIEGKNNTLSFPSYYIDENAVICLDGGGCKIRSGLATTVEDLKLDTSIACDSCDRWYHAFCVGFDPENASEGSWLCPRCITDELSSKVDGFPIQSASEQCDYEAAGLVCPIEDSFSGKVLVSIADAGETAVVVSMVEGKQLTGGSHDSPVQIVDVNMDGKPATSSDVKTDSTETEMEQNRSASCLFYGEDSIIDAIAVDNQDSSEKCFDLPTEGTTVRSTVKEQKPSLSLSLSQDASLFLPGNSLGPNDERFDSVDETLCKPSGPERCEVSSALFLDTFVSVSRPSEALSNIDLQPGLHEGTCLPVDKMTSDVTELQLAEHEQKPSVTSSLSDSLIDKVAGDDVNDNVIGVPCQKNPEVGGMKRKHAEISRDDTYLNDHTEFKEKVARIQKKAESPAKKAKSAENSETSPLSRQVKTSISNGSQGLSIPAALPKDSRSKHSCRKESTADIMSIVKGTERRSSKGAACPSSEDKSTKQGNNVAGLRIKKIMHRVADDKESSTVLQKLRKEIREAVRNKSSKDSEIRDILDVKLLAAFRAAVGKPQNELSAKSNPSVVRAKKMMLQKGKIREKLTKKIYGTSSGRRRHAWDRDWEIEFWKHRCMKAHPEKVQTLRSVLDLLRTSDSLAESSKVEQGPEGQAKNSILSRLYLADTSVFPRKEDIKPLSALTGDPKQEESNLSPGSRKFHKPVCKNHRVETSMPISRTSTQDRIPSCNDAGSRGNLPNLKREASCRKVHPSGSTGPMPIFVSSGSKGQMPTAKENSVGSDDVKSDKRKWALEVLARKTALESRNAAQGKQEDNIALKGTYSLLAQLPGDMRPVLSPIRNSKVPMSIRQAQLYRLAEHYLSKTNLSVMHRTADTELAIADAVNVEKEICDRSNSKLVYVNLCSQELLQHTNSNKPKTAETTVGCPEFGLSESTECAPKEPFSDPAAETSGNAEAALKMAGLLSDSPPNSPYQTTKDLNDEEAPSAKVGEESIENVLDIDSHPDLDIYGDFEYNLEEVDDMNPSNMPCAPRVSQLQLEDGNSKMKVVFSTINRQKISNALDSKYDAENFAQNEAGNDGEKPGSVGLQIDSSALLKSHTDTGVGSSILGDRIGAQCLSSESHHSEGDGEPCLAECEELYGLDKEPLVHRICDEVMNGPEKEVTAEKSVSVEKENCRPNNPAEILESVSKNCDQNNIGVGICLEGDSLGGENSPNHNKDALRKDAKSSENEQSNLYRSIARKVEAYVKEHIRPLCKSGVITNEQYRWAVGKTTEKVMKYHCKAKNANFLIKEGDKVKKLAEQYVEAAHQK